MHFSFKVWCVNKSSSGDFISPLLLCQDSRSSVLQHMCMGRKQSSGCFVCLVPNIWVFGNIWKSDWSFLRGCSALCGWNLWSIIRHLANPRLIINVSLIYEEGRLVVIVQYTVVWLSLVFIAVEWYQVVAFQNVSVWWNTSAFKFQGEGESYSRSEWSAAVTAAIRCLCLKIAHYLGEEILDAHNHRTPQKSGFVGSPWCQ